MVIEIRIAVDSRAGGLTKKKHKGNFRGDGNVLDLGNGNLGAYICQNSLHCILLNICVFHCV